MSRSCPGAVRHPKCSLNATDNRRRLQPGFWAMSCRIASICAEVHQRPWMRMGSATPAIYREKLMDASKKFGRNLKEQKGANRSWPKTVGQMSRVFQAALRGGNA